MAISSLANNQFALDVQGLEQLKHSARSDADGSLKEAAKQFEALFLQSMLKSMRDAMPESDLMGGSQSKFYDSLMDQQWAQHLSRRGVGLADQLVAHLQSQQQLADRLQETSGSVAPDTLSTVEPRRLGAEQEIPVRQLFKAYGVPETAPVDSGADEKIAESAPGMRAHPVGGEFVKQLQAVADEVSQLSGIPAELMVAQAVLETGWGKHRITTEQGEDSFNLFGIKATADWRGEAATVHTHEVVDGERRQVETRFRVYDSYRHAFEDYAALIGSQSRYREVLESTDAEQAARALQQGGYATDPGYAEKLIALMRQGNRPLG